MKLYIRFPQCRFFCELKFLSKLLLNFATVYNFYETNVFSVLETKYLTCLVNFSSALGRREDVVFVAAGYALPKKELKGDFGCAIHSKQDINIVALIHWRDLH